MALMQRDTYEFQRLRLLRIVSEVAPGKIVEFDEATTLIKFRVRDNSLGVNLTEPSGEWFPDELGDKSDNWLRNFIKQLSNGKL